MNPLSFRHSPISEAVTRSPLALEGRRDELKILLEKRDAAVVTFEEIGEFGVSIIRKCADMGFQTEEVVAAFNSVRGLSVVGVEPPKTADGGSAVVVVFRMRNQNWKAKLARPTERANLGEVRLTNCRRDTIRGDTFSLDAVWHPGERSRAPAATGDFLKLVADLQTHLSRSQTARAEWNPVVVLGQLSLRVLPELSRNSGETVDEVLNSLMSGKEDVFAIDLPRNRKNPDLLPGLMLWLPKLECKATLISSESRGAGPNDLFLVSLRREFAPDCNFLQVRADWKTGALLGPRESNWRDELRQQFENGLREVDSRAPLYSHPAGPFHLVLGRDPARINLANTGFTLETLCEALSQGARVTLGVTRNSLTTILVRPPESEWWFTLQDHRGPMHRRVDPADWNLISIYPFIGEYPRSFAHIHANWIVSSARVPTSRSADRDGLLDNLTGHWEQERKRRGELAEKQGIPPNLEEKVDQLGRLHELARQLLEVGVVSLERLEDGSFLWVPRESQRVFEELKRLREDNPEGVQWEYFGLELFASPTDNKHWIKCIFSPENDWESLGEEDCPTPLRLKVLVDDLANSSQLEQLASRLAENTVDASTIRVFLASGEWKRIKEAIALFDPRKDDTRSSRLLDDRQLSPSIVTFHLLRRALVNPESLNVAPEPPELSEKPLRGLSEAQIRAVRLAVYGPDITFIQGPPGTGKSTVIVEILRQLFKLFAHDADFRVLFVAPTHAAVDNVLERLVKAEGSELVPAIEMGVTPYRLGPTKKIAPHLRDLIHDCFHSSFLQDLRDRNQESVRKYDAKRKEDEILGSYLRKGVRRDVRAWSEVIRYHKQWPRHLVMRTIPGDLSAEHAEKATSQAGRNDLWRELTSRRAQKPDELYDVLLEWTRFVEEKSEFLNQLQAAAANLICATSVGCATAKELSAQVYDYVIIDEAGKEEWRKLLLPVLRGQRWIFVGDPKQLPPFADEKLKTMAVANDLPLELVTRSLLEDLKSALTERGRFVFLDRQGRMHPDISVFVSQTFYPNDGLRDFDDVAKNALPGPNWLPSSPMLQMLDTSSLDKEKRSEQIPEPGKYVNIEEAELAIRLVMAFAALPEWKDKTKSFGIIAPYGRQMKTIRALAEGQVILSELIQEGRLQIGTVDSFQGQERNLIVFSNTRSNDNGKIGFMDDLQRLNVALSRAKSRLLVVADSLTITNTKTRDDTEADREIRRGLEELYIHVRDSNGLVVVPKDWREKWLEC